MLALTTSYHTEKNLQKEKSFIKFIWVRQGSITLEIDHQEVTLAENEVISLLQSQHLEFLSINGGVSDGAVQQQLLLYLRQRP